MQSTAEESPRHLPLDAYLTVVVLRRLSPSTLPTLLRLRLSELVKSDVQSSTISATELVRLLKSRKRSKSNFSTIILTSESGMSPKDSFPIRFFVLIYKEMLTSVEMT